jgi:hypothetical protein
MEGVMVESMRENNNSVVGGFKDEYNGTSLIRISNNSIIYVATNYRVMCSTVTLIKAWRFRIFGRRRLSIYRRGCERRSLGSRGGSQLDTEIYRAFWW